MNIAIVGAGGAVGQELLKVLDEQNFPVDGLRLFGRPTSAGTRYCFRGREVTVEALRERGSRCVAAVCRHYHAPRRHND